MEGSFEKTHQRYQAALDQALSHFKALLASRDSKQWKPIQPTVLPSATTATSLSPGGGLVDGKGKAREASPNGIGAVDFGAVQVHKRSAKGADIVRAVTEVAVDPDRVDVDDFKGVLQTPEVRGAWDRLVEQANVVELLDPQTRIAKTDFRLGWPANPRDTITVCKTFSDGSTVIDISTSLPRSNDEPAYLRPSPPFVRAHVLLLAWCVQIITPNDSPLSGSPIRPSALSSSLGASSSSSAVLPTSISKARITVFWQVNWKGAIFSTHHTQISSLLSGFVDYVRTHSDRIPLLSSYGRGVQLASKHYDQNEERMTVEYAIVADEATTAMEVEEDSKAKTVEGLAIVKERRRLERAVELKLPSGQGWDVVVTPRGQGEGVDEAWAATAEKEPDKSRTTLRFNHASLTSPDHIVRVTVVVCRLAGGRSLRVNGNPINVATVETRNPGGRSAPALLDPTTDTVSIGGATTTTGGSASSSSTAIMALGDNGSAAPLKGLPTTAASDVSPVKPANGTAELPKPKPPRPPATQANQIAPLLRRSYIYFTSLLQEPEAKWRHVSDYRGVTVTQLKSIDPTLTIYRAEATFVGVGVWDVYSTISTSGARAAWDRNLAEMNLLEDLNDLSSLWHMKTKATWPVVPRDSVVIRTAYKSPTSVHLFSSSTDDSNLFPSIPAPDVGAIRTQVDLRGWSIEALSPTTTQITLIDQTNPKGWTPKSWTPSLIAAQVAGAGEFAIKNGGPPVITRLLGAKVGLSRYEHDKGLFRAEYSAATEPIAIAMPMDHHPSELPLAVSEGEADEATHTMVEFELRSDVDTWASSLDLVVDPPPAKVSCLSRHRLSSGGGCWVTIEHERSSLSPGEKVRVLVRRGRERDKEKGSVWVNGKQTKVDVEALPDDEVKLLSKRRRVKASPIPLDQYPLTGPRLWRGSPSASAQPSRPTTPAAVTAELKEPLPPTGDTGSTTSSTPKTGQFPLSSLAVAPKSAPSLPGSVSATTKSLPPIAYALEALARLQAFHVEQGPDFLVAPTGWTPVAERGHASVYRKIVPAISEVFSVYRGDKVVEGVTADEMCAALAAVSLRPKWDDRIEKSVTLASYGNGCTTSLLTTKSAFPFKGRVLYTTTVNAQVQVPSVSATSSTSTVRFVASSSFPRPTGSPYADEKLNPQALVEANMLIEGWIMETLDPYSSSTHAIPSTRCTYFSAIEYGGSVPVAFNSMLNSSLPRLMSGLEHLVRNQGPLPRMSRPSFDLKIDGPLGSEGMTDWEWRVADVNPTGSVLVADVDASTSTFAATFLIAKGAKQAVTTSAARPRAISPHRPTASASRHDLSRASHDSAASSLRHLSSVPNLRHKNSGDLKRIAANPPSTPNGKAAPPTGRATDLVVGEIVLDRKLYPSGYDVAFTSAFSKEERPFALDAPLVTSHPLPVAVSVHEMPTPAVFAASLDPTAKRHLHLLRFTLPTSNVKLNDDGSPTKESAWYEQLLKRDALVRIEVKGAKEGTKDAPQVTVQGAKSDIVSLKESQALLDRWEDEDYIGSAARLSRVTRKTKTDGAKPHENGPLPAVLSTPAAVASALITTPVPDAPSPGPGSVVPTPALLSPVTEAPEPGERKPSFRDASPVGALQAEARSRAGSLTPLTDVLGAFPIGQIGAVTTAALSRTYTTRHLVMTALIFFLLGSLLRSLLSPADFFIVPDASTTETRLLNLIAQRGQWREARRLLELRWPLLSHRWALIVATVRQAPPS